MNTINLTPLTTTSPFDGMLARKTDNTGQQVLNYTYDNYKRVTQVSTPNALYADIVLRTYSYDTNPYDGSCSQNAAGRLTAVLYSRANGDTFTDMFSYWAPGAVKGNRLRVARTLWNGVRPSADVDASYVYDGEGRMNSATYPTTYDQETGIRPARSIRGLSRGRLIRTLTTRWAPQRADAEWHGASEQCAVRGGGRTAADDD